MTNETNYKPCRLKCNGATKDFPFEFQVHKNEELFVNLINTDTQETTLLVEGSDYSATLEAVGGNVTTKTAYANNYVIEISRQTSYFQGKTFSTSGGFQASEIENAFDRVSCGLQDMDYNIETFKEEYSAQTNQKIEDFRQEILDTQQGFELEINTLLEDVTEASKKINMFEEGVNIAVNSSVIATEQAMIATEKTNDVKNNHEQAIVEITDLANSHIKEIQDISDEIKNNAKDIINRVGLNMFDPIHKDHILTYEETKGLALQGTYVYKQAIAGSRYGYPDFYNKVVKEFNESTSTETVNGVTVKVHSNGHKFYDIADKTGIDGFFDSYGSAWFYGVDTENERVFLPRNNWFEQATGDISEVGRGVEAGLPYSRIYTETAGLNDYYGNENGNTQYNVGGTSSGNGAILRASGSQSNFDGLYIQDNNGTYGKSNTVQPPAVKKLLYICVGNTTSYEGMTEVVNQGMEILEQVNQGIESRLDVDVTNLTDTGKENVMGLLLPDLTTEITRSNSGFTSDTKQWLLISGTDRGYGMDIFVNGVRIWSLNIGNTSNNPLTVQSWYPLDNGDVVTTVIKQGGSLELKTYSMKGVK